MIKKRLKSQTLLEHEKAPALANPCLGRTAKVCTLPSQRSYALGTRGPCSLKRDRHLLLVSLRVQPHRIGILSSNVSCDQPLYLSLMLIPLAHQGVPILLTWLSRPGCRRGPAQHTIPMLTQILDSLSYLAEPLFLF